MTTRTAIVFFAAAVAGILALGFYVAGLMSFGEFSAFSSWSTANILRISQEAITAYLFIGYSAYLLIMIFGYLNCRRHHGKEVLGMARRLTPLKGLTPISILVPAYNEQETVVTSVTSLLGLEYPQYEVIVINDGSTDATLARLTERYGLELSSDPLPNILPCRAIRGVYISEAEPRLIVIDKENGRKADSLNAGINASHYPLICCIDCDSVLGAEGLIRVATPFFEDPERTVAVGGIICPSNSCEVVGGRVQRNTVPNNPLAMIQTVEYLRAFIIGRMGWDYIDCNMIISGAFGLFDKKTVIAIGGYDSASIGEDLELLLRIHRYCLINRRDYDIRFLPDPVCWTEVPEQLVPLGNQRSRWHQGLGQGLWKTRSMLFASWSKQMGWIGLPYLWLFEFLSAPIEVLGYLLLVVALALGVADPGTTAAFFAVTIIYGMAVTLMAVVVEELTYKRYTRIRDFAKLALGAVLEPFGFRQLHLFWRCRGVVRWLTAHESWGEMPRRGFRVKALPQSAPAQPPAES